MSIDTAFENSKLCVDSDHLSEVVYKPTTTINSDKYQLVSDGKSTISSSNNCNGFLYVSACAACLIAFVCGISFSWTSPVIPKLKLIDKESNPLPQPITSIQESWIAGLLCFGGAFGPFFSGKAADVFGRKRTLVYLAFPILLSYLTLGLAHFVYLYYAARFLKGLGVGGVFSVLPMYLGEISQDHNRGLLGCLMAIFVTSGILFSFGVGPFLTVKTFCFLSCLPLIGFILIFGFFIPESPLYLVAQKEFKLAEESLMKLRSTDSKGVKDEFSMLLAPKEDNSKSQGGLKVLFTSKGLRRGFTATAGLVILQQLSGINAVLAYMESIFQSTGSDIPPSVSTVLVGTVQVFTTVVTVAVVEKLGRKTLLLISTLGSCISIVILGLYFYLKNRHVNLDNYFWLPIVCLLVYIIAFNLGIGPLPWGILGEMFPGNVKSIASTLTTFTCFFTSFIITLLFPILVGVLDMTGCFWLFGGCLLIGIIFIITVVPETKGKSLDEIQDLLNGR